MLKVLAIVVFLGSIFWFAEQPSYEPAIASLTSLSALIGLFLIDHRKNNARLIQKQTIGDRGMGIQAGGDIDLNVNSSDGSNNRA